MQRGVACHAAALHDQGTVVQNAAAVVMISTGDGPFCFSAVPDGENSILLNIKNRTVIGFVFFLISIQRMAVQIQREALAGFHSKAGIIRQGCNIFGKRDDLAVFRPIDGRLKVLPGRFLCLHRDGCL